MTRRALVAGGTLTLGGVAIAGLPRSATSTTSDLAVAVYKAKAPVIKSPALLSVAVSIHSVEARHAAWMRRLVGILPAGKPFDEAIDEPEILRIVASTGFITSPTTTRREEEEPRFTG